MQTRTAPADAGPRTGAWTTLVELLRDRAEREPDLEYFAFLGDGVHQTDALTAAQLDLRARALAVLLRERLRPGSRLLLNYQAGLEFVSAFFGCLYAEMIAVPIPPIEVGQDRAKTARMESIARSCAAEGLLATADELDRLLAHPEAAAALDGLELIGTDEVDPEPAGRWRAPRPDGDAVAYLQYSSGSTGTPKGVALSHANVLDNLVVIHDNGFRDDRGADEPPPPAVLWLPFFHDMGLVNGILQPLHDGYRAVHLPPMAFVHQPVNWLRAIAACGRAISVAPNFAYELCVRRVRPEQIAELDLSGWQLAGVGAEPVRPGMIERFSAAFAPAGFRRKAFFPCYGLAEATVMVSGGPGPLEPVIEHFDARRLAEGRAAPGPAGPGTRPLVACGRIHERFTVRIVDPEAGTPCPPGHVGEVYVAGASVGHGYWNAPQESARTFGVSLPHDPGRAYLRTGDLGFLYGGQLYITGRRKDTIILDGLNYYPHDVEAAAEAAHPALRENRCCAFSVDDDGAERLVVLAEVQPRYGLLRDGVPVDPAAVARRQSYEVAEIEAAIRRAVTAEHGIRVSDVVLLRAGTLPFTSSGKLKRAECRERYRAGIPAAERAA